MVYVYVNVCPGGFMLASGAYVSYGGWCMLLEHALSCLNVHFSNRSVSKSFLSRNLGAMFFLNAVDTVTSLLAFPTSTCI